ncbi:hypothetical protein CUMW_212210 [Citrus unshiu]|nr:hypothetical protein CUMW_212210 [Citrus unshiu]
MEVGTLLHSNTVVMGIILSTVMQSLVGETQKSLLCLLLVIGYQFDDKKIFPSSTAAYYRFPLDELTKVKKPVEENKDAGETEDADSDDDNSDADEEEDGDGDDGSDYEAEDSDDDDAEANGDSDGDEDDDDNDNEDDDEDDDDDDDDEDDEDDDDDDDEPKGPPSKRKK